MRCLVTGGAGFIGSNLVDALVARGDQVAVIDNLTTGKRENLAAALAAGAQLHEIDVRDARCGRRSCSSRSVLSSCSTWPPRSTCATLSKTRPPTPRSTCSGAINVLAAAHRFGAHRVVNTSTGGGLYGDAELLPTPEGYEIAPLAPYGQSKLAAEGYCELYARLFRLSTVSLRYGNVYGPRQDVHGEAGVVAIFCGCLLDRSHAEGLRRRTSDA